MDIKVNWRNTENTRFLLTATFGGVSYYGICIVRKGSDTYLFEPNSEVGDRKYKYYRFDSDTKKSIINAFLEIENLKKGE